MRHDYVPFLLRFLLALWGTKPSLIVPDNAIHFYRTWTLPNLRSLEAYNFVPIPFIVPSLTSLSIEFQSPCDDDENPRPHSLRHLLDLLSSAPFLEDLNLLPDWLDAELVPSPVVLHHLKTFRVHFAYWSPSKVSLFANALATPAIRKIHLSIERQPGPDSALDPTQWLHCFFGCDIYATLEELTFKFNIFDDLRQITMPLEILRNLRALTLETGSWIPKVDLSNGIIPPLRSLYLYLNSCWTSWLGCVQDKMRDQGTTTDFQDLSISVYGSPIEEWAKEISKFPNISVVWLRSPLGSSAFI